MASFPREVKVYVGGASLVRERTGWKSAQPPNLEDEVTDSGAEEESGAGEESPEAGGEGGGMGGVLLSWKGQAR
jgi:hypothetical protein